LQAEHILCYQVKLPNLRLKTRPKQLLGSLPLVIALPRWVWLNLSKPSNDAITHSITTLIKMTFNKTTLSIRGLYVTLSKSDSQHK
jgi:hypothetical protein